LPTPPLPLPIAMSVRARWEAVMAMRASFTPGSDVAAERSSSSRLLLSRSLRPVASAMIVATPLTSLRERIRSSCGNSVKGSAGCCMART
jgi:hypothetical protein